LQDKKNLQNLVDMRQFRGGWQEGFDYVDTPEAQKLKAESEGIPSPKKDTLQSPAPTEGLSPDSPNATIST
jgi:hypothetical protein